MLKKHPYLYILFFFCANTNVSAQKTAAPVEVRTIDEKAWERAKEGIDFSKLKKLKPVKPKENKVSTSKFDPSFLSGLTVAAKAFFFIVLIAIIGLILYLLVGRGFFSGNARVNTEVDFTLAEIEENLHESDLERFLRLALEKKDYKMALRIYYLMILKSLSIKEKIIWKRDKTNSEYLREMQPQANYERFRRATLLFDRVWYSDVAVQEADFNFISPTFKDFYDEVR